jgi:transposase
VPELQEWNAWLVAQECRHVVLESTKAYWEPVYNVLEGDGLELRLANPQEVKNRRRHKTDKKDAWWLAHPASFAPPAQTARLAPQGSSGAPLRSDSEEA